MNPDRSPRLDDLPPTQVARLDRACDRFEDAWRAGHRLQIENFLSEVPEPERPELLRELLLLELELRRAEGERPTADEYRARFPGDADLIDDVFREAPEPHPDAALRPRRRRPAPDPAREAGRNLLFGVLALQNDFISRDDLVAAFAVWVADKARPLGQVLVDRGALDDTRRTLLEALVGEHLKRHGGDPMTSLAAVSSLGSVREDLGKLADPDLQASLSTASSRAAGADDEAEATATFTPSSSPHAAARFRVLRFHKQGGLGRIYVARDAELGRDVALKEIRPDRIAAADLRARFVLEAEITGGLEHPGIVPVYSLGTYDDGRPFYAMRFVAGDSLMEAIEAYHSAHPRPDPTAVEFRKLLGRFVDVCEAIAFAHSKGVLHRDLKPHNVMLGRYGETLLIDWGLAKATGHREPADTDAAREATLVPPSGGSHEPTVGVIGSPAFMSPEQAAGVSGVLGPATDVYGLGAILYTLLTGQPPVTGLTGDEVRDRACRGEITPPRSLNPNLPRSLEAVCLKALALRPEDRYPTARALADDVEHWLADEPVSARRDPLLSRLSRRGRRHRTLVASLVMLLATGLIAVSVGLVLINRERLLTAQQRDRAIRAEEKAHVSLAIAQEEEQKARDSESETKAVLEFFQRKVLAAARPKGQQEGLGREATIRAAIEAAEPGIEKAFAGQPTVEASIRDALATSFFYLGKPERAVQQFERAWVLLKAARGPTHPETLQIMVSLAAAYAETGRIGDAITLTEKALEVAEATMEPDSPGRLEPMSNLAVFYRQAGRIGDAISLNEKVLALFRTKLGNEANETLICMNNLAGVYLKAGRTTEAIALHEEVFKLRKARLGPDHPNTLSSMNNVANAYWAAGRSAEALPLLAEALKLHKVILGPDHPQTLKCLNNLANAYADAGHLSDAVALYEERFQLSTAKLGLDHPDTLESMRNLANAYLSGGRIAEATPLFEQGLKLSKVKLGPDHPDTLLFVGNLARSIGSSGRTTEAIPLFEQAIRGLKAKLGPDHPVTLAFMNHLALVYLGVQRWIEAETISRKCLDLWQKKLQTDDWGRFATMSQLGAALAGQNKYAEAEPLLLASYQGLKAREAKIPAPGKRALAQAAARIVPFYEASGRPKQAAEWRNKLVAEKFPPDSK
jgi:serine/threonine protein kinase